MTSYISGAASLGVTLQGTLLNHSRTMSSIDAHIAEYEQIWPNNSGVPLVMSESNSLYNEGKPGLSNSFGAALWNIDFKLYCASVGFKRVHMHMGTNYRVHTSSSPLLLPTKLTNPQYAAWQPINTINATIGTKPPYYGQIAAAAFLGNTLTNPVAIAHIPLTNTTTEAAYAAYSTATNDLVRAIVINMNTYNTTFDGTGLGLAPNPTQRGSRSFAFDVAGGLLQPGDRVGVQRLSANGSDAISGISWDGWSYNYELDGGRPVRLANVSVGEFAVVGEDGTVAVSVPDASAVVLSFAGDGSFARRESGGLRRMGVSVVAVGWVVLGWALW